MSPASTFSFTRKVTAVHTVNKQVVLRIQKCRRLKVCRVYAVGANRLRMVDSLLTHPDAVKRRQSKIAISDLGTNESVKQNEDSPEWWTNGKAENVFLAESPYQFQELLSYWQRSGKLVVVKFFAPHCNGCKTMAPKFEQIALKNSEVVFIKFNAGGDNMRLQASEFGVTKLPFFHIYYQEECLAAFTANLLSVSKLRRAINTCKMLSEGKKPILSPSRF